MSLGVEVADSNIQAYRETFEKGYRAGVTDTLNIMSEYIRLTPAKRAEIEISLHTAVAK